MNCVFPFAVGGLTCVVLCVSAWADDPPKKLTMEERLALEAKWKEMTVAGMRAYQAGRYPDAQKAFEAALEVARQAYAKDQFPDGHTYLAASLNNLARLLKDQGKLAEAEPLYRDALDMLRRLFKGDHPDVATSLNNLAVLLKVQGKLADAKPLYHDALDMRKRLFKGDHSDVANSLNNLAVLLQAQGKLAEAEPLFRDALSMKRRLFKGDNPELAMSMNSLAVLLQAQGKLAEAEPLFRDALDTWKRLFKGDHPSVALSLNNLAFLLRAQGKLAEAEPLYREALDVRKRLFKGDHPDLAQSLNNLGFLLQNQGKWADAELLLRDALEMRKRLFKGDHSDVANSLDNLAGLLYAQGKPAEAEPLSREALEMRKRLFKGDHPDVARNMSNLAGLYWVRGKLADAEPLARDAFTTYQRLVRTFTNEKSEGEALTLIASMPLYRDGFLSIALQRKAAIANVYSMLWSSKGDVARVHERRALGARAAAEKPEAGLILAELAETRRRRAELILAPTTTDPGTREKRDKDVKNNAEKIEALDRALRPLFPPLDRADKLARGVPDDLRNVLPTEAVFVDLLAFTLLEHDKDKPGVEGEKRTPSYAAVVVSRDGVTWIDLNAAEPIDEAVGRWREAITKGKEIPSEIPAKVRELVWSKIRPAFPNNTKIVYLSPDLALSRVPWSAIPGDKPGTILLEDFAVATIPHGPFLLDKLSPEDPRKNPPTGALVVGGVKYDAELTLAPSAPASRGDPLVKPGVKPGWSYLPGTAAEATGVSGLAATRKVPVTALKDDKATTSAVLAALPKAKYAHFATHGFFADPSFRSIFQLDEKDYEKSWRGERIGRAVNSPMVMTGLVFAGANNPKTSGRGIVTGEALIDVDLSGLELAVLSACETGLGDVAGGEGTFGLQRAFHVAGTRDVIASLWKVPDQSTAALMALFYRNLWTQNLSPMEALRQAQLEIYRNPSKIPDLANGFRGKFEEVSGPGSDVEIKPNKDGKAHPLLWAAFTLSGPGR